MNTIRKQPFDSIALSTQKEEVRPIHQFSVVCKPITHFLTITQSLTNNPMYEGILAHNEQESCFVPVDGVTYDTPRNQTHSIYSLQGCVDTNVYDYADEMTRTSVSLAYLGEFVWLEKIMYLTPPRVMVLDLNATLL